MFPALQVAATVAPPLFTNDLNGFTKILGLLVGVVLLPVAALVVYFLKRGPDAALAAFRSDLNGLGTKVNGMDAELGKTNERVNMLAGNIANSQRDIMEAIRASSEAQIRAVHLVEVEVARLQERNNLGDCLVTFGNSIRELATSVSKSRGD